MDQPENQIIKEHFKDARLFCLLIFLPFAVVFTVWLLTEINEDVLDAIIIGGCTIIASLIAVITGQHIYFAANLPIAENNRQNILIVVAKLKAVRSRLRAGLNHIERERRADRARNYRYFTDLVSTYYATLREIDVELLSDEILKSLPEEMLDEVIRIYNALSYSFLTVNFYYKEISNEAPILRERRDIIEMNIIVLDEMYGILISTMRRIEDLTNDRAA
ncbi:MAG: hypothetical protein AAF182_03285 [Pseudomonadota bacterium]